MNLGAFGKTKSPSIGSATDTTLMSAQEGYIQNKVNEANYRMIMEHQAFSSPAVPRPYVGPAQMMPPSQPNRYTPSADDSYYGATEVFTPETKSMISTPVLIVASLALVGVLAYATGIIGKAS